MNVLFITHHYLSSNGGGSFASRAYINAFAEVADEMTLLYPTKVGENLFPEINKKIKAIPVEYNIPRWRKLIHLLIGKVHRYFKIAKQILNNEQFDLVVFDTSLVSYRLIKRMKRNGMKVIVIHHNYQYEYFRDNSRGFLALPTLFWCRRYEKQAVQEADLNMTLTKQDIDLLSENYQHGLKDNFTLLGSFEFVSSENKVVYSSSSTGNHFIITGNLEAFQTYHPLVKWLIEYYPILKEVCPDATVTIAGKNPNSSLKKLCLERNINLISSPTSMDPLLENADYYICPTDLGGGIKLRIMDGLKYGLPIITHSISARGYDVFKENGCLFTYENIREFRDALNALKKESVDKQSVQLLYRSIFSFESGVERIRKSVSMILACGSK